MKTLANLLAKFYKKLLSQDCFKKEQTYSNEKNSSLLGTCWLAYLTLIDLTIIPHPIHDTLIHFIRLM